MAGVRDFLKKKAEENAKNGGSGAAAGGTTESRKAVNVPAGRYTGVRSAEEKAPPLEIGRHRIRVLKTYETKVQGKGRWFHVVGQYVKSNADVKEGEKFWKGHCLNENAEGASLPRIMSFVRASAGFSGDAEMFEALNETHNIEGEDYPSWCVLIDACHGNRAATKVHGENPLRGRLVDVVVVAGKNPPYTDETWTPVPEEDQDNLDASSGDADGE